MGRDGRDASRAHLSAYVIEDGVQQFDLSGEEVWRVSFVHPVSCKLRDGMFVFGVGVEVGDSKVGSGSACGSRSSRCGSPRLHVDVHTIVIVIWRIDGALKEGSALELSLPVRHGRQRR